MSARRPGQGLPRPPAFGEGPRWVSLSFATPGTSRLVWDLAVSQGHVWCDVSEGLAGNGEARPDRHCDSWDR